jgi:hypothetical protein
MTYTVLVMGLTMIHSVSKEKDGVLSDGGRMKLERQEVRVGKETGCKQYAINT